MNLIPETPDEPLRPHEDLPDDASAAEKEAFLVAEDAAIAAMTDQEFFAWISKGEDPLAGLV
jgi:hypothetical protein